MNTDEIKTYIKIQFIWFKVLLRNKYKESFEHIKLSFKNYKGDIGGGYNKETNEIIIYCLNHDYTKYDKDYLQNYYSELLLHELAHVICNKYDLCDSFVDGEHNLSFGIVSACLHRDILFKKKGFYNKYDLQDELELLKIDIDKELVDRFIMSIKFKSVSRLATKSLTYAEFIRKNIIKTITYKEWYGE
jgi:hypothetical protein